MYDSSGDYHTASGPYTDNFHAGTKALTHPIQDTKVHTKSQESLPVPRVCSIESRMSFQDIKLQKIPLNYNKLHESNKFSWPSMAI